MGQPGDYAAVTGDSSYANADHSNGVFNYYGNGSNAVNVTLGRTMGDIADGTSNSLMIGEKHYLPEQLFDPAFDIIVYSAGVQASFYRKGGANHPLAQSLTTPIGSQFGSWHTGSVQFVLCDGSVRGITTSIPGTMLGFLTNIKDGNPVSFD
jgi:hypothetical protein